MRAMPSMQDSTRPVSRTAIEPSKPLISLLSISLISDGRMSAINSCSGLTRKFQLRLVKPPCEGAVVCLAAEFGNHAAQQFLVDLDGRDDLLFGDGFQAGQYPRLFLVRWLHREGQCRALAPEHLVNQFAVCVRDGADLGDSAMTRDHHRQRSEREAQVQALGVAQLRRSEARFKFGRVYNCGQALEFAAPILHLPLFCEFDQSTRVAFGDSGTFHRCASSPSRFMKPSRRWLWSAAWKWRAISSRASRAAVAARFSRTCRCALSTSAAAVSSVSRRIRPPLLRASSEMRFNWNAVSSSSSRLSCATSPSSAAMRSDAARARASASSNASADLARLEWIVEARAEKNLRSGGPPK